MSRTVSEWRSRWENVAMKYGFTAKDTEELLDDFSKTESERDALKSDIAQLTAAARENEGIIEEAKGLRETALESISKAHRVVEELCIGKRRWTMSVPADEENDSDLVITKALMDAKAALAKVKGGD